MADSQPSISSIRPIEFSVPCVRELTQSVKPVSLQTPILDILLLFQSNAGLSALPVMDDKQKYFGIISRRNYLNMMTRAYARELYARKNLTLLVDTNPDIFVAPLVAYAENRIDQVMMDFLSRDPGLMYEALPVVGKDGIIGVVKIADMMLKLSESQGRLIATMKQLSTRLNEEVANAAALQRNLLRPAQIELPGIRGLSTLITSSEVGGDFYDYYAVDERWIVILVGDVSGHGIAAGTIVCAAKAGVNFLEAEKEKEPHKILSRLSNIIFNTAHQSLLMTMFAICLDTCNGELRYANAGHQFAYLYRSMLSRLDSLELGGLPLGKNEHTDYEQEATEMDVGDRLFLYTDSIVEEENSVGECFGYERLEELLVNHAESDIERLNNSVLEQLTAYVGRTTFDDDVTIFCVEHFERTVNLGPATPALDVADTQDFELVRIVDTFYRANPDSISSRIGRQNLVFLTEGNFSDLIPGLSAQGVRRVLLRHDTVSQQLGWDNLLRQHQNSCTDDLAMYLDNPHKHREFEIAHSDDKGFIIQEVEAWLEEMSVLNADRLDAVILLLDELIENGLYAAPQDNKGFPLYAKGTVRELGAGEILRLTLSIQEGLLGISLIDNWGTLTPSIFLERLSRHTQGLGLDSGVGGGGLYLIWRMSDYLQLRVFPHRQTQVCVFLDLKKPFEPESDKGFQFLYHTEVHETVNRESFYAANSATTFY
jgi:serine phosphatase RsbU (regulator of sigma subunit)